MPLPLLIAAGAVLLGGYGVKKGFDAKEMVDKANKIVLDAQERHKKEKNYIEQRIASLNDSLLGLSNIKIKVFQNQIKYLVDFIRKNKSSSSKLKDFNNRVSHNEFTAMEKQVDNSLQLGKATKKGLVTGTIAASAVYGATQSIATASLSTNIAILFGTTTATEATLGFLGGGSIAMGSAVIGGIALGPALAIGGFVMASKAEESLTEAVKYESDVDKKIAQIIEIELIINSIEENLKELSSAINKMAKIFDEVKVDAHLDEQSLAKMFAVGKSLKGLLDISVLKEDGSANNIKTQISGYLEV